MPAGVFKRCLVWGEITSFGIRGGLEYSSRGFFPGVVKSPAACSSAAKTGEISPASVPERGLYPVFRWESLNQGFHVATLPGDDRLVSSMTAPARVDLSDG